MMGDINGDNVVNVLDIIGLVNIILSINYTYIEIADMNYDGKINIYDLIHMVEII
jgi:hypothetical protein